MNGNKARAIRKAAYGDDSTRQERVYGVTKYNKEFKKGKTVYKYIVTTLFNLPESPRALYQRSKTAYNRAKSHFALAKKLRKG